MCACLVCSVLYYCQLHADICKISSLPLPSLLLSFLSFCSCFSLFLPLLFSSSPPTFLASTPIFVFSWDTLAWPRRIVDQVEQSEEQLEQDEQKFHKKLLDDQTQLEDKLDTLQVCATLILTTQSIFSDIIAPVCWTDLCVSWFLWTEI